MDYDNDGVLDVITGSFPGDLYVFGGIKTKSGLAFNARTPIMGGDGKALKPGQAAVAHAADLDGDGDLDLVSGLRGSGVVMSINKGTRGSPSYAAFEQVEVDGKEIPHIHCGPLIADWDGDGRKDLLVGVEENLGEDRWNAQVLFYRNVASSGLPKYQAPVTLIDSHPGLRLKMQMVDYDKDGRMDLLVGDMFADCPQKDYTGFVWLYRRR